jgi:hypothetical protein
MNLRLVIFVEYADNPVLAHMGRATEAVLDDQQQAP